jgi:hypothetical protein
LALEKISDLPENEDVREYSDNLRQMIEDKNTDLACKN